MTTTSSLSSESTETPSAPFTADAALPPGVSVCARACVRMHVSMPVCTCVCMCAQYAFPPVRL